MSGFTNKQLRQMLDNVEVARKKILADPIPFGTDPADEPKNPIGVRIMLNETQKRLNAEAGYPIPPAQIAPYSFDPSRPSAEKSGSQSGIDKAFEVLDRATFDFLRTGNMPRLPAQTNVRAQTLHFLRCEHLHSDTDFRLRLFDEAGNVASLTVDGEVEFADDDDQMGASRLVRLIEKSQDRQTRAIASLMLDKIWLAEERNDLQRKVDAIEAAKQAEPPMQEMRGLGGETIVFRMVKP